ncbi:MAG TPA: transposase [Jiangellaceae bacterium]|nr:transposase [Jiangellaceae bacterium]
MSCSRPADSSPDHILDRLRSLPGPVAIAYEAGPTGFCLYRAVTAAGIRCAVAAPSRLQRPSGDRVKTDARDAVHRARLLRLDEITAVSVPTLNQEAARDLVRAREDCRGDLMRARHRLSKLLLRHGTVYSAGKAWTGSHDAWLRQQRLEMPAAKMAYDAAYDTVLATSARPDRLDEAIEETAADGEFTPLVRRLGCLRGVSTLTAFCARGGDR